MQVARYAPEYACIYKLLCYTCVLVILELYWLNIRRYDNERQIDVCSVFASGLCRCLLYLRSNDPDLDQPNTGGSLLRGDDRAVGAGLTQSSGGSGGWVPPPYGGFTFVIYSWASNYFTLHPVTTQQGTVTSIQKVERERRPADRLFIRHFR